MKTKWKDISSYLQSDKVRTPYIWEYRTTHLSVRVHRYHGCNPASWFLSCHQLYINRVELSIQDAKSADAAKAEALDFVKVFVAQLLKELS